MKEQEVKIVFFMRLYMLIIVLYVIFECLKIGNQIRCFFESYKN